ncbi:DUF7144 family membrane protein [Streptomyces alkaliterrae]|uniref:DUF7144 domain-containing protein n=1 Tax=Streptomyces alkaliterrae TaxID=2213162 RepID=A0A5P0YZD2_9ACTN|nr:hypothetical protein [Streptomyces alkaliterrae]MBB1259983.1 hypothetical protein [Streptomyces alkaliterrae]MQS04937.1 hypothetical protein [Streptomyces alkaliterrae]
MSTTQSKSTSTAKQDWAVGLTMFAAVMLSITGILAILRGIMGIAEDDVFVATPDYVFQFDLTGWGWMHLILGALAFLVSLGLYKAALWARIAGVIIAGLVILGNFLSMPYYPFWSLVVIAIAGFVIWALCVVRQDATTALYGSPPEDV